MKKYKVVANVYHGGTYLVKSYNSQKKAEAKAKKLNSSPDMYTWFEVEENKK